MRDYWVQAVFLRIVLPLSLLTKCVIRPSSVSLMYGILGFCAFLVPLKRHNPTSSDLRELQAFIKGTCFLTFFFSLFTIAFGCSVAATGEFKVCEDGTENLKNLVLQFLGLLMNEQNEPLRTVMFVLPEAIVLIAWFTYWIVLRCVRRRCAVDRKVRARGKVIRNAREQEQSLPPTSAHQSSELQGKSSLRLQISELFCIVLIGLSGVIRPCLFSVLQFLLFLPLLTWWKARFKSYSEHRLVGYVKAFTFVAASCQLGFIYLFQTALIQHHVNFDSLSMRLLGLTRLINASCGAPSYLPPFENADWRDYANPAILLIYCVYTIIQMKNVTPMTHVYRERLATAQGSGEVSPERVQHRDIRMQPLSSHPCHVQTEAQGDRWQSLLGWLLPDAVVQRIELYIREGQHLLSDIRIRFSYAPALIAMMAWAVIDHSCLTSIFLFAACLLWIVPYTRILVPVFSAPILLYSGFLLIIQYIFSLRLNQNELPSNAAFLSIPLSQIGLVKQQDTACDQLMVQVFLSALIWLTMASYRTLDCPCCGGSSSRGRCCAVVQHRRSRAADNSVEMFFLELLGKFWIYLCVLVVIVVAVRPPVTIYGIVYMCFFSGLVFLALASPQLTRRLMHLYWWSLLIVFVADLLTVYVYQFPLVQLWWVNVTGFSSEVNESFGLTGYSPGELLYSLLTSISLVTMIAIHLTFFHKSFLRLTEPHTHEKGNSQGHQEAGTSWAQHLCQYAEVHIAKVTAFSLMYVSICQPAPVHFPLVILSVLMCVFVKGLHPHVHKILSLISCFWVAVILWFKMLFQMPFFQDAIVANSHLYSASHRSLLMYIHPSNISTLASWLGFEKTADTYNYLYGHVLVLLCLGMQAVIYHRQHYHMSKITLDNHRGSINYNNRSEVLQALMNASRQDLIFSDNASWSEADKGLKAMVKYLINHAFYRFGVEITLIAAAITVSIRMDVVGLIYAMCVLMLTALPYRRLKRAVWVLYVIILVLLLPIQYFCAVGVPPTVSLEYPWPNETFSSELVSYLYLPNLLNPPNAKLLICDFVQLLFACCQRYVFCHEYPDNVAGDNTQIIYDPNYSKLKNPVKDFVGQPRTVLDFAKTMIFQNFHWIILSLLFAAGYKRDIFSVIYLIAFSYLLYKGNELFLKPMLTVHWYFYGLILIAALVIVIRTALQLVGCVYYDKLLSYRGSWLIRQLFKTGCVRPVYGVHDQPQYRVSWSDEGSIEFDVFVFAILLFQLRIVGSQYIRHVVTYVKAEKECSHHGAVYIREMMKLDIQAQKDEQHTEMEQILTQVNQMQASRNEDANENESLGPTYETAKRAGHRYMFREQKDEQRSIDIESENRENNSSPTPTVCSCSYCLSDTTEICCDRSVDHGEVLSDLFIMQEVAAAVVNDVELKKGSDQDAASQSSTKDWLMSEVIFHLWRKLRPAFVFMVKWNNKWSQRYRYVEYLLRVEKDRIRCSEDGPPPEIVQADILESVKTVRAKEKEFYESNVFWQLYTTSTTLVLSHTEMICYAVMVVNNMRTASIISLFFPCMAFLWGAYSAPRPRKGFWQILITGTFTIIVLKYVFHFVHLSNKPFPLHSKIHSMMLKILGIQEMQSTFLLRTWDHLLLFCLCLHRISLRWLGLWDNVERATGADKEGGEDIAHESSASKITTWCQSIKSSVCDHFHRLFHPRWYVQDLYAYMLTCDLVCFLILVFFSSSFDIIPGNKDDFVSAVLKNEVPFFFIIILLAQFSLMVADRAIYVKQSQKLRVTYHFFLVIVVHIYLLAVLPFMIETPFHLNVPAQSFYLFKCVYFMMSAWQIRSGYHGKIHGDLRSNRYTVPKWLLFKVSSIVPFLHELRLVIDWTCTDTCMGLIDFVKMENIYAYAFLAKCKREYEKGNPSHLRMKKGKKKACGTVIILVLILIILAPVLLFSLLNRIGERCPPNACTLRIGIEGYSPFYESVAHGNFLAPIGVAERSNLNSKFSHNRPAARFLSDYDRDDIVKVTFSNDSDLWTVAPPAKISLIRELKGNSDMSMYMSWEFARPRRGWQVPVVLGHTERRVLSPVSEERKMLISAIESSNTSVTFTNLYFPFVAVPREGTAREPRPLVDAVCEFAEIDCTSSKYRGAFLNVTLNKASGTVDWWQAKVAVPGYLRTTPSVQTGLYLIAFVSRVFPSVFHSLTKEGIIGFYVVSVYAIYRLLLKCVPGSLSRIMWDEVPNIDNVLKLCSEIYMVREKKIFETEIVLFSKLLFLFRSPTTMIDYTLPNPD